MNNIIKFLIILYLASALGVWVFVSRKMSANADLNVANATLVRELATTKNMLVVEQTTNETLRNKISDARANADFLSLALCPTLETSKGALCVKDNTEWLSQTIQTGTTLTNTDTKTKMGILLVSLGGKKKPTSKEFYELLKPIETSSLKALIESLR